ncbi:hypothetical protein ABIE66_002662 [Peribacillus sp. B2I2]|uniref:hypothetical protein n=1 Tax=Peribacillus sp. B2I2 TaxID=3156468 RepID=UPI0035193D59
MGKYKTFSVLIFTLFITFSAGNAASASNWALIGDTLIHDPSIIKEGNTWYRFGTGLVGEK